MRADAKPDDSGYPAFTDAELDKWMMLAYENNRQAFTYCGGGAVAPAELPVAGGNGHRRMRKFFT